MSLSKKHAVLAAQAKNFSDVLSADPGAYGQSAPTAAAVSAAVSADVASVDAIGEARASGVRSEQMTVDRNLKRTAMLNLLRPIYTAVQASTTIGEQAKIALGVHVIPTRRGRAPVPLAPLLSVHRVDGRIVTLRVSDPQLPTRKGRAPGTEGITIFKHVGERPPAVASQFEFVQHTGQVTIDVPFPASVPLGTTVWFVASSFNQRKESGPASAPVSARLGAGLSIPAPTLQRPAA
jgi:hypothetical protein